jgi:hypothetical protein
MIDQTSESTNQDERLSGKRYIVISIRLLIIICIIAILVPVLSHMRFLARRMMCGTHLATLGMAMHYYANCWDEKLPKAGGLTNTWTHEIAWDAKTRKEAFGITLADPNHGKATITSHFYLVLKYSKDATPKDFVCPGETNVKPFKLSDVVSSGRKVNETMRLHDAWDFGPYVDEKQNPTRYCSYSYQYPFTNSNFSFRSPSTMVIAADRNPWLSTSLDQNTRWDRFMADSEGANTETPYSVGNSDAHKRVGQNVLYVDEHVAFHKQPNVGLDGDNIYTIATSNKNEAIMPRAFSDIEPLNKQDSYLVQENGQPRPPNP